MATTERIGLEQKMLILGEEKMIRSPEETKKCIARGYFSNGILIKNPNHYNPITNISQNYAHDDRVLDNKYIRGDN